MNEAIARLRDAALPQVAAGSPSDLLPLSNAHVHLPPNFSAFETTEQAVALAAAQGVRVLGASNYYDYSLYGPFAGAALASGVYPLFGLEIIAMVPELRDAGVLVNDPGNPGKYYLCGRAIARSEDMTPEARRLLGLIRGRDVTRIRQMTVRLAECFRSGGVPVELDEAAIIDRVVRRHGVPREVVVLQERHVAQAFQEDLFRLVPEPSRLAALDRILGATPKAGPGDHVRIQNEIRSHLMKTGKPAYVEECFVSLSEAYRLVLELGGIPCYTTLADGANPICEYEYPPEKLIEEVLSLGIHFAELIPLRNEPQVLERYVRAFRNAGFVVTAGTEHNTLDLIPMEPACIGGAPIAPELKAIFAEGACVAAAHQYLRLRGECGYVDDEGRLNPGFRDGEERIRYFHRLGAAVIAGQAYGLPG
jgi:hypothetical protein